MPRSLQRELDVAVAAAEAGGRAALASFGTTLHVDWKSDDSPVSEADRAADAAIRASIDAAFPDDGVLSEESGARPGTSGRRWLIDPVDGTRAFLRGLPHWCTLIALEAGDEIVVGVLAFPSLGRVYRAARGHGAWRGETRLEIASPPALARCSLVLGEIDLIANRLGSNGFLALVRAVGSSSSYGAGYGAALVLDGKADVWIEGDVSPWDIAPYGVLFEEAGARYTNLDGARGWPGASGLAAAPTLHREVLDLLARPASTPPA